MILSIFEFILVVAVIVGLLNEKKLIRWENRQARKIKKYYRAFKIALEDCRK
jgi:hypothetical protein